VLGSSSALPSFLHHPTEWVVVARFMKEKEEEKNQKPALQKVSSW
jgi:hypothetical protein